MRLIVDFCVRACVRVRAFVCVCVVFSAVMCDVRALVKDRSRVTIGETDFAPMMGAINKVGETGEQQRGEIKASIQQLQKDVATKDGVTALSNKVATKQALAELRNVVATKAECKDLSDIVATKDDLNSLRNEMAKDADLTALRNDVATKADLNSLRNEMAKKADLDELKKTLNHIKDVVEATQDLLTKCKLVYLLRC